MVVLRYRNLGAMRPAEEIIQVELESEEVNAGGDVGPRRSGTELLSESDWDDLMTRGQWIFDKKHSKVFAPPSGWSWAAKRFTSDHE